MITRLTFAGIGVYSAPSVSLTIRKRNFCKFEPIAQDRDTEITSLYAVIISIVLVDIGTLYKA